MTTASIPPEKMMLYGALAIAGYWFVSQKSMAGNGGGSILPRMSLPSRNGSAVAPAIQRNASNDASLFTAVGGILGKWLSRSQTTVNNADGSYSQNGYEGNAPDVYGREAVRNSEKGDGYYGGSEGDTYGENRSYTGPVGSRTGGYGDYSASNDGTAINPAPQYGSVYDAAVYNDNA